ncbi:MAG: ankyrin repeat domain-containing protein [Candidatus Saccharimonadales bacterium]
MKASELWGDRTSTALSYQERKELKVRFAAEIRLMDACRRDSASEVRRLLDLEYADPNFQDFRGGDLRTPLIIACESGSVKVVRYLLSRREVIPTLGDRVGRTGLDYALHARQLGTARAMFKHYLSHGVDEGCWKMGLPTLAGSGASSAHPPSSYEVSTSVAEMLRVLGVSAWPRKYVHHGDEERYAVVVGGGDYAGVKGAFEEMWKDLAPDIRDQTKTDDGGAHAGHTEEGAYEQGDDEDWSDDDE